MSPAAHALRFLLSAYRAAVSPWLPPSCRFEPTCSRYATTAIEMHGACRGTWLTLRRLARCRPGCPGGFDPVPFPDDAKGSAGPSPPA